MMRFPLILQLLGPGRNGASDGVFRLTHGFSNIFYSDGHATSLTGTICKGDAISRSRTLYHLL
jgi:hypothetical protein